MHREGDPSNDRGRSRALAALCLASRRLNDAATRTLYHRPRTPKWWLLGGTLLARPDLAQHVKELYFPMGLDSPEIEAAIAPESEAAIAPEFLAYYNMKLEAHANNLSEPYRRGFLREHASLASNHSAPVRVSLVTSLCPRAETVKAVVNYFEVFDFCAPASLPSLRTVELVHCDSELGMDLKMLVPLSRAAPNLRTIRCFSLSEMFEDDLGVTLDQVREIELQNSAVGAGALGVLLRACPRLETFVYEAGGTSVGDEQFDPSQARDVLLQHGRELKRVVIDLAYIAIVLDMVLGEWDVNEKDAVLEAFEQRGIEFELIGVETCWEG